MNKAALSSFSLLLALTGCTPSRSDDPSPIEPIRDVAVLSTANSRVPDVIVAVGTVRAAETSQIAAQVMGIVMTVNVHEGDSVRPGQTLATIDSSMARAALQRAEAGLAASQHELMAAETERSLTESTFKRYDTLYQRKSVSPQEHDEMKARYQSSMARAEAAQASAREAKAAVSLAQTNVGYTRLRAPFAGIITERKVDSGSLVTPGSPVLTVEAAGHYRLETTIDETNVRFVDIGDPVSVALDARPGERFAGKVTRIVPAADPNTRTFLVKIELPSDSNLRSGLFGRAYLSRGERDALMVPRNAVVDRGMLKAVYVVGPDQTASLRYVSVGDVMGDRLEVLSGLNLNETIVASPQDQEIGGKKVEIR
jgi:RND family efflux transporter MFP subunit